MHAQRPSVTTLSAFIATWFRVHVSTVSIIYNHMYASLILLTSHLQASASSQLDMVMPGAVSTSGQNHPLVERQKLTCGVSVCRLPAVCRDFILSWCHTWSLLSLHTKESQVFRGPWSVPQRDLIGAIHHFVMRDANRHVLRKSQHLHSKRCVSAPRNVASFSKHNSRCTRSRCKSHVEQLRGGVQI